MRDDPAGRTWCHPDIHWPAGMSPAEADTFVCQEIVIAASPEGVFERISDVTGWPSWLPGVGHTRVHGRVGPAALFEVELLGTRMDGMVGAYLPPTQFGWAGATSDLIMYQAWLLTPVTAGARVTAEEVARGEAAPRRDRPEGRLLDGYRRLLDRLKSGIEQEVSA
jgi:uncharacterized protein YndB with AHSA1/START domain